MSHFICNDCGGTCADNGRGFRPPFDYTMPVQCTGKCGHDLAGAVREAIRQDRGLRGLLEHRLKEFEDQRRYRQRQLERLQDVANAAYEYVYEREKCKDPHGVFADDSWLQTTIDFLENDDFGVTNPERYKEMFGDD